MAQIPKIEIEVGVRNTCVCTEIPSGTYPEVTFETVYCSYHAQKIDAIKATLREQIAREIETGLLCLCEKLHEIELQNFPESTSFPICDRCIAAAIARGGEK